LGQETNNPSNGGGIRDLHSDLLLIIVSDPGVKAAKESFAGKKGDSKKKKSDQRGDKRKE